MFHRTPRSNVTSSTFRDEGMNVGIPLEVTTKGVKNTNANNSNVVDTEKTQNAIIQTDTSVDMDKVKEKYPDFFEIEGEPFRDIELYVWQMAENTYYCGLMFGTDRLKTDEEIWALQEKALLNELVVTQP